MYLGKNIYLLPSFIDQFYLRLTIIITLVFKYFILYVIFIEKYFMTMIFIFMIKRKKHDNFFFNLTSRYL